MAHTQILVTVINMQQESVQIQFKDITRSFTFGDQSFDVLKGLSFEIKAGELVSIVGPSGSGKSTTMNILGFLDTPSKGSYYFEGKSMDHLTTDDLAHIRSHNIGFIFQSFHLLSQKTVFENVMLPLFYRADIPVSMRSKRVAQALEMAQLDESLWHKKTNIISGGQRQRVAIARALVSQPAVLLADEPTGNLDTHTGAQVMETLKKLNKEQGTTVIIITHDDVVAEQTDRIIEIVDGEIVKDVAT